MISKSQKIDELEKAMKEIMVVPISEVEDTEEGAYFQYVPCETYMDSEGEFKYYSDFEKFVNKTCDYLGKEDRGEGMGTVHVHSYRKFSMHNKFDIKILHGCTSSVVTSKPNHMMYLLENYILYSPMFEVAYKEFHEEDVVA